MKKLAIIYLLIVLLPACSLLDDSNSQNETTVSSANELSELFTNSSSVRIISFIEDGRDKTNQFSPYRFSFNTDGSIVATLDGITINGTYRVFRDDGRLELEMNFPSSSPLSELDDDWYFISRNSNTLTFEDSGDRIVFEF
jgi:hypothetical protein